jgi:hypothetical protein
VSKVLEECSLETDPELNDARDFVARIWKRATANESSSDDEPEVTKGSKVAIDGSGNVTIVN